MLNRLKNSNWLRYVATLIIGGLLVALGYLIGDSAPSVEAQNNLATFDTLTCKGLTVFDGNPEHGSIWLGILEERPTLVLSDHADLGKSRIQIQIGVDHGAQFDTELAVFKLINDHNDGSSIGLVAGRGETASIDMTTKKRMVPGVNLMVGSKGSGIMLEGNLVQAGTR